MSIPTTCPTCKAAYQLNDALAGKNVRCKACGETILVAAPKTPLPYAEVAQLTKTPGIPAKTKPLPTVRPAAPAPKEIVAPAKRAFPLVAVLLAVAALGIVVLTGLGAVSGLSWYLISSKSTSSEQETEKSDSEAKKDAPRRAPADDFHINDVRKSVVFIKRQAFGTPLSTGSGFLMSQDGLIYTNRHVIEGDGRQQGVQLVVGVPTHKDPKELEYFNAEVVYVAPPQDTLDFAILKIVAKPDYGTFPTLRLATENAELGEAVAAIGFPLADVKSPTLSFNKGSISADLVSMNNKKYYQTDAAINPGNSGGPLVNTRGEVLGLVTLKRVGASNMAYALYVSEIKAAANLKPEQIARVQPVPGPIDVAVQAKVDGIIEPRLANWQILKGQAKEENGWLVVDNNGGDYYLLSKDDLPDNFQVDIHITMDFLEGTHTITKSDKVMLGLIGVRIADSDPGRLLGIGGDGYYLRLVWQSLNLMRDGKALVSEPTGTPPRGQQFQLTIIRNKSRIAVLINGETKLAYFDPAPIQRKSKLCINSYLTRMWLGEVKITPVNGEVPIPPIVREPGRDRIGEPKPDPVQVPKDKLLPPPMDEPRPPAEVKEPVAAPPTGQELKLPAPATDLVAAAGGKLLVLYMPSVKKLAIVDVASGTIVKELPADAADIKIAAGQDKLIVMRNGHEFLRYDLKTFEREGTGPSPFSDPVKQICMGSSSNGPLMLANGKYPQGTLCFLDPMTFKVYDYQGSVEFPAQQIRASGDGKLYSLYSSKVGEGYGIVRLEGKEIKFVNINRSNYLSYLFAGGDGQALFSDHYRNERGFNCTSGAVYSPDGKLVSGGQEGKDQRFLVPALAGGCYFDIFVKRKPGAMELFDEHHQLIAALTVEFNSTESIADRTIPFDKRIMYSPLTKRVIAFPRPTNTRLLFYNVEVKP